MRRTAALIVGGGPAGSAAAITLARAGLAPELIERSAGPRDTVCGGFLGWDALAALRRLGLDLTALGARPITDLRLLSRYRTATAPLPAAAAGLSRRALDSALLAVAEAAGTRVHRGRTVRSAAGRQVRLADGEEFAADALILATGKHELRGLARPAGPAGLPLGLRTALRPTVRLAAALAGVIELHLFDGGYAGLLLQEDGRANLCLSVAPARLKRAGGVEPLVAGLAAELPQLGERLADSELEQWSSVAQVPYGWRARTTAPGLYRVGDQAAVIASLAGDGIAIALASGVAAAEALLAGESAPAYQRRLAARLARPLAVAELLRGAVERGLPRHALLRLVVWQPSLATWAARLTRAES